MYINYSYQGRAMAQAASRLSLTMGWIVGHSLWDLWWTKWHWDKIFPDYFAFLLSI